MRLIEEHRKSCDWDYESRYKNPIAQQIIRACSRLETACNLIEKQTNAPSCLYFCISKACSELNEAINKYYGDFPNTGVWNDR